MSTTSIPGAPHDAQRRMMYGANKKSVGVAYLVWLFLGGVGGHRLYVGKTGSAIAMLCIPLVSFALMGIFIGFYALALVGLWALVDAFLIPGWVNAHNRQLIARLNA